MTRKDTLIARMRYWCDEANLGYDQGNRWDIRVGGESDCSSLVYWCLWEAGYLERPKDSPYKHDLYTGTLGNDLVNAGWKRLPNNGRPTPGMVLLNDNHHVAVCTAPGLISNASIDENGRATGGKSGDQTDRETITRDYYNYPWTNYYEPPADPAPAKQRIHDVQLWDFCDNDNQRFFKRDLGDGIIALRNVATWEWLSDPNSSTVAAPAQVWGGTGGGDGNRDPREPQLLRVIPAGDSMVEIAPLCAPNLRLDSQNGIYQNGNPLQWFPENGTPAQKWLFRNFGDVYNIINAFSLKAVDVKGGGWQ